MKFNTEDDDCCYGGKDSPVGSKYNKKIGSKE